MKKPLHRLACSDHSGSLGTQAPQGPELWFLSVLAAQPGAQAAQIRVADFKPVSFHLLTVGPLAQSLFNLMKNHLGLLCPGASTRKSGHWQDEQPKPPSSSASGSPGASASSGSMNLSGLL